MIEDIPEGRIKFLTGDKVAVFPTAIKADGGAYYCEIVDALVPDTRLFLRAIGGIIS